MSVLFVIILTFFINFSTYSSGMYSNREMEGYSVGYLTDCPKARHEPVITKKTLKRLSFFYQVEENKRISYNFYQMKLLGQKMDFNKTTMVYIGGFLDFPSFIIGSSLGNAYYKLGYNALLVDTHYFTTVEYPVAALFSRTVAKHVAEMLFNLTQQGLNPKKLEFVGLSLGGQTISYIAKHYRELTGKNVSRLTGLDPAGPCFRRLGPEDRLDLTDADFVETINTNIDGFGMAAPVGHVNYYVNGGEFQPGDIFWMPCNVLCSHMRSVTLWLSALENQDSFIAMQCASVQEARNKACYDKTPQVTNIMGLKADKSKQGIFFLATGQNYPYFLGKKGLKRENEFFSHLLKDIIESDDMVM